MLCSALETTLGGVDRAIDSMDALVEQCRTRSDCFCDIEHQSRAAGGVQPILISEGLTVYWSRRGGNHCTADNETEKLGLDPAQCI